MTLAVDAEPRTPAEPPGPPSVQRWVVVAFAIGGVVLLAIAAMAIAWKDDGTPEPSQWAGQVLDPAPARPSTDLIDTSGNPFDLRTATAGHLTLVFFGYTSCPDICSIQMATLAQSVTRVEVPAKVVFITTDPDRDTPDKLRRWLDSFDPNFIGLTGTPDAIAQAQQEMGVTVATAEPASANGSYTVGHSSAVYVFTSDDYAHLAYPAGTRQQDWANDLPAIAAESDWQASS